MSWTDEKVNKLKELWGKGNTASQIAEIIGGISRNAVIGKAHRLNLSAKIKTRTATSNENFDNSIEEKNWKLKFFGAGEEFDSIKDLESDQLNVFEHLPRNELYDKTKEIPVGLISLDKEITVEGFPGKTFDYLSMNKILLCFANSDSAVSKFIEKYELGFTIDPYDETSMKKIFDKLNDQSLLLKYQKNINNLNKNILNKSKVVEDYYSLI